MKESRLLLLTIAMTLLCAAATGRPVMDPYGGWTEIQGTKTGFFHTEQIDGRWWLVTPDGHGFFSTGMYCVRYGGVPDGEGGGRLGDEFSKCVSGRQATQAG